VTDANKKLRELRDFVEECHMESEQDAQRAHPKQIGMRLAWRMVRGEIDILLAEPEAPPCEFCGGSLAGGTDGHGLGECVPVCPFCDGSGSAPKAKEEP
jgi:hypothetical protein